MDEWMARAKEHGHPGLVITDAASVKQSVLHAAATYGVSEAFVGAHPIAGRELSGPSGATSGLFAGKNCLLIPGNARPEAVKTLQSLWQAMGMRVNFMEAERHDRIYAAISHLPCLLAMVFVEWRGRFAPSLLAEPQEGQLAGFSRTGYSSRSLWQDIFWHNRQPLLEALTGFCRDFTLATFSPNSTAPFCALSLAHAIAQCLQQQPEAQEAAIYAGTGHQSLMQALEWPTPEDGWQTADPGQHYLHMLMQWKKALEHATAPDKILWAV
jgi:hypothetical protein